MHPRIELVTLCCALTACAGRAEKAPPVVDSITATASSTIPPVVSIVATDFAFDVKDTITGGLVTLRLVNQGKTLHHVQLLRLLDGKTFADLAAALKAMKPGAPPPSWMQDVAGPNSPVPGGESLLTEDLQPGPYAIVCFIDTPDKVPHFAKGMMHPLTVLAPTGTAPATPVADVSVDMTDYAWSVTPALTAGRHLIKLTNSAAQSHELFLVQLARGKTADDMMKWGTTYEGPPPGTPMGGISGMATGGVAYLPVTLTPGNYLLVCFLPDARDGKPHFMHGMIKTLTVS